MNTLRIIFSVLLIFIVTNLYSQKRLTSINSGLLQQELQYLGIEWDNLYYIKVRPNGYDVMKESLLDNELESEVIHRIDISVGTFTDFAIHNGKVLLNNSSILLVYDIVESTEDIIDISYYAFFEGILYSHNKAFIANFESLIEINLETFEIKSSTDISKDVLDGMSYNMRDNNVLLDSVAFSFIYANGSSFYSVNLHSKEITLLEVINPEDYEGFGIWDAGNRWYYFTTSYTEGQSYLYSFLSTVDGIEKNKTTIDFDISTYDDIIYITENHIISYQETITSDLVFADKITILNLDDGTVAKHTVVTEVENQTILQYTPEGYYAKNGNKLQFADYDGNYKTLTYSYSNYSIPFNYIGDPTIKFNNKWLVRAVDSEGTSSSLLVNQNSIIDLGEVSIKDLLFDEVANRRILLGSANSGEYVYYELVDENLYALQENENPALAGGEFELMANTFDPIIKASNKNEDLFFLNLKNTFTIVDQSENPIERSKYCVQVGDYFYSFRDAALRESFNRFHLETNKFEKQAINYLNKKPYLFSGLHKGSDYLVLETYVSGSNKHISTMDLDGNFYTLKDENNLDAYSFKKGENIIYTNGQFYALAKDPSGGTIVAYKVGKDLVNTNILFDNHVFTDDEGMYLLAEGDLFSYINAGTYFFIKNDGETIYFNEDDTTNPYFYNGKFYFDDKYFDESLEVFVEWDADIDNIQHIQNDIAFSKIDDNSIALVNINTLDKEILTIEASDAIYFTGETHIIIYLPQTRKLYWSDGTLTGTHSIEVPENIKVGKEYIVKKDFFIFTGSNEEIGYELFILDSTAELTTFDINQGLESSSPSEFISNDTHLYFVAFEEEYGKQLYSINLNFPTSTKDGPILVEQIEIYPNPSSHQISINSDLLIQKIEIINDLGKKISTFNIKNKNDLENFDISYLSSGIYYLKYLSKDQIIGVSTLRKL